MIVNKPQFRVSLFVGGIISFILVLFIGWLFYTLFSSDYTVMPVGFESRIYGLLKFTLYQAFLSIVLSILVGLLLAWALAHQSAFKGRSLLVVLFSSSLVLPTLIVVFGLIGIFGRNGWINQLSLYLFDSSGGAYIYGLSGILLAHVYLNASFASRALLHGFESIPIDKYKLSKSLGFSIWQRFWYVEYPALKSTLFSIGSTIFLLCFTSFAVVLLLGGSPSYNTLEVAIYEAVRLNFDIGMALKLALVQLGISAVLVWSSSSFRIGISNLKVNSMQISWGQSRVVRFVQKSIIMLFAMFFISPLLVVIVEGFGADFVGIFSDRLFLKSFLTSIYFATISSVIVVLMSIFLSDLLRSLRVERGMSQRWYRRVSYAVVSFLSNIYLAIPSLVLGLGFFLISMKYEAPLFTWSGIALVVANVLMSLPFAMSVIAPMMEKSDRRYGRLASSLGLSMMQKWVYVDYPYLRASLGYVMALAFCFSLGDLGIIALFGSDEFTTLPWYLYRLMGSYNSTDASGVALILLVLVLAVFTLLPRLFGGQDVKDS